MVFAPEYIRSVLAEDHEDAKRPIVEPLVAIHRARLVMPAGRRAALAAASTTLAERSTEL